MSTKDCVAALNARLDTKSPAYDGNRKFKRVSKKKDDQGRTVREFRDNLHTFVVIGDAPDFEILLELPAGAPVPSFAATAPASAPATPLGYFQEDQGQFTLVLKGYWDEHAGVDPDADLEDKLPPGFFCLSDATFEYDGEIEDATVALVSAGFVRKLLSSGSSMGEGWYFSLGGPESDMVEQDFEDGVLCGFYLVRKSYFDQEGFINSVHVSEEFPDLPEQFDEVMEACFLSSWDVDTTRAWLLENGFETNAKLEALANGSE